MNEHGSLYFKEDSWRIEDAQKIHIVQEQEQTNIARYGGIKYRGAQRHTKKQPLIVKAPQFLVKRKGSNYSSCHVTLQNRTHNFN